MRICCFTSVATSCASQQGLPWVLWESLGAAGFPNLNASGTATRQLSGIDTAFGLRRPYEQPHHEHHGSRASTTHAKTGKQCATCKHIAQKSRMCAQNSCFRCDAKLAVVRVALSPHKVAVSVEATIGNVHLWNKTCNISPVRSQRFSPRCQ